MPPRSFLPECLDLIMRQRYAEARRHLEPVVADHPNWARARLHLALTYHKAHRYAEAKPHFKRVLELDPQEDATRIYYGWSLYYLGELAASRKMFASYPARKAGFAEACFALGLIDFDDDRLDSATAQFQMAIKLAQVRKDTRVEAKARARLADVLNRTGALPEARAQLEQSLALNPDNYEAWFKLSRALQRLGDAEGAERARRKHAEVRERIRPTHPNTMGRLRDD